MAVVRWCWKAREGWSRSKSARCLQDPEASENGGKAQSSQRAREEPKRRHNELIKKKQVMGGNQKRRTRGLECNTTQAPTNRHSRHKHAGVAVPEEQRANQRVDSVPAGNGGWWVPLGGYGD